MILLNDYTDSILLDFTDWVRISPILDTIAGFNYDFLRLKIKFITLHLLHNYFHYISNSDCQKSGLLNRLLLLIY